MLFLKMLKNHSCVTTEDDLIHTLLLHRDLMFKEGTTNIGGIPFYHFQNDSGAAEFSYGTHSLTIEKNRSMGDCDLIITINPDKRNCFQFFIRSHDDSVHIPDKSMTYHSIPLNAFNEFDFFQYTLLNLSHACSDDNLINLVNLLKEF
ncbi:hypothetical protein ENKO_076 [Klebsiella phage fENko-Kae01]|nr:hypothetical protein [Salmonella enterica]WNV47185.1 hypothetical protein [Klebsiella phage fENko-Kae01]